MTANDSKSTPKKAEDATRHPLALLADYIEANRARDAAEAAIRSEATGCSDFVRAVTRELDAREALMQLDPAALRVRVDIEADGMRAGLNGHAGTHNPYIWKGAPEHREAWSCGQQAVQKYGQDRYQMGYEKAQEVAAVTAESALRAQAEAEVGLREALRFYADTENYRGAGVPYLLNTDTEEVEDDWGATARAALAQAGGES